MLDNLNVEWLWMGLGFIVGVGSSLSVSDLIFPIKDKDND
jgi:hypothetical protein